MVVALQQLLLGANNGLIQQSMAAMAKASSTCTVEKRMAVVLQPSSGVNVQWSDHQENGKLTSSNGNSQLRENRNHLMGTWVPYFCKNLANGA